MHRDDGSTLPLVAGLFALVLGAACAIVDVSSLFLERARIAQVADSAARVGAEAFDITDVTVFDSDTRVALQPDSVARAVADYIALSEPQNVSLVSATTPDARTAVVVVQSDWQPPIAVPFLLAAITVSVTGSARIETNQP